VERRDSADAVGDEPLLLAQGEVPVAIGADRVAAARCLRERRPDVVVVVADDGLQHLALARTVEIVAADATRGMGNGWLMPSGPLREPVSRLAHADALVVTGAQDGLAVPGVDDGLAFPGVDDGLAVPGVDADLNPRHGRFMARLESGPWRALQDGVTLPDLATLPRGSVHAIAGIAHPQRFFAAVAAQGIGAITHPFPDHHRFVPADLDFPGARAILMTGKDAVKCRSFADARMAWLPVRLQVDAALVRLIEDLIHGSQAA
jgi:tetraacyldisaccharide 4'-kinase